MNVQSVVWAKMRLCSFWPAVMLRNPPEEIRGKGRPGQICVQFFGTNKYGYVNNDMIKNYAEYRDRYSAKKTRGLANAVARCEEFLSNPANFGHRLDAKANQIVVQNELPFQIKDEPEDEEFFRDEQVQINNQANAQFDQYQQVQNNDQALDQSEQYQQLENDDSGQSVKGNQEGRLADVEMDTAKVKSEIKSFANRYDNEIDELKKRIDEITGQWKIQEKLVMEISEWERKYEAISKQRDEAVAKKEELESQLTDSNMKVDEMAKKIADMAVMQKEPEDDIEKRFKNMYESEKSALNDKLAAVSKQCDDMIAAKQKSETQLADANLKLDEMAKKIAYTAVMQKESEEDIEKRFKNMYESEKSALNDKLAAVSKQCDDMIAAKQKSETQLANANLKLDEMVKKLDNTVAAKCCEMKQY